MIPFYVIIYITAVLQLVWLISILNEHSKMILERKKKAGFTLKCVQSAPSRRPMRTEYVGQFEIIANPSFVTIQRRTLREFCYLKPRFRMDKKTPKEGFLVFNTEIHCHPIYFDEVKKHLISEDLKDQIARSGSLWMNMQGMS